VLEPRNGQLEHAEAAQLRKLPPPLARRQLHRLRHRASDHRDPHSFPTRRSSDLGKKFLRTAPSRTSALTLRSSAAAGSPGASKRSEEHTSELQSRGQLVCRLLLEKKNIAEQ